MLQSLLLAFVVVAFSASCTQVFLMPLQLPLVFVEIIIAAGRLLSCTSSRGWMVLSSQRRLIQQHFI